MRARGCVLTTESGRLVTSGAKLARAFKTSTSSASPTSRDLNWLGTGCSVIVVAGSVIVLSGRPRVVAGCVIVVESSVKVSASSVSVKPVTVSVEAEKVNVVVGHANATFAKREAK